MAVLPDCVAADEEDADELDAELELAEALELALEAELALDDPPDDPHAASANAHATVTAITTRTFQRAPMGITSATRFQLSLL